LTLLYFAWLRQKIGKSTEEITLPPGIATVKDLIAHLQGIGPAYAEAFADHSRIRAAVNQHHAGLDAKIAANDEIAFFPPVTGG